MTANDIADMVEKEPYHTNLNRSTIAYFIRQQQAEIEALKGEVAQLKHMNKNWAISEGWALQEIERLKVQYGICEDKP